LKSKAGADVSKVRTEISGPDQLHREATVLRAKYSSQLKRIASLDATLKSADEVEAAADAAAAPRSSAKTTAGKHASRAAKATGQVAGHGATAPSAADKHGNGHSKLSKAKARSQFLAGLFSAPWNKAGGLDHASM